MPKLNWHAPDFNFCKNSFLGSDTAPANVYLLRNKYNIEVAQLDGVHFRRYNGKNINRLGYAFPLSENNFDLKNALDILKDDAKERGEILKFCLCDEKQQKAIDNFLAVEWESFVGDSDYIYSRETLSRLSGRKLHKRKNLFNRFMRIYPEAEFLPLTEKNLPDALQIAQQWFTEHDDGDITMQQELSCIKESATYWKELEMHGGIIYVDGEPAAMSMYSILSEQAIDVHFEKAIDKYAVDGAFAAINKFIAASDEVAEFTYINREEDMGIPGLQKVKEEYQPDFKLKKFYGVVTGK